MAVTKKTSPTWVNPQARGVKGKREDVRGTYFRSRWEANVARFLDILVFLGEIREWEYEPQTFEFPIKRGTKYYTPDFRITRNDGTKYWIEVKGWMDDKSRIKLKRFGKHYPDQELSLVDTAVYREIEKVGKDVIPHWE